MTPSTLKRAVAMVLVGVALSAQADEPSAGPNLRVALNIKAQPVREALQAFGEQTGLQVLFRSEGTQVEGVKAATVSGEMEAGEALGKMLERTGLRYEFVNDKTVRVAAEGEGKADAVGESFKSSEATETGTGEGQVNAQGDTSAAIDEGQKTSGAELAEIVVTATKREEKLQDVPLSIAVVTADDIDRRGLVSSEDYLRGIPGVNQAPGSRLGQSIIIRGIESSPAFQNLSPGGPTVATYFGETPTTSAAGAGGGSNVDIKLVDIERVEILRGPQGTAFGNSSMGGAVRTIPTAPKLDRFEAKVAANYSATSGSGGDNTMIQAVGNLPLLADKLAIRATAYRYEDSGYYRNHAGSDAAFHAAAVTPFGADAFAADEGEAGASTFTGGRIAALFQATDDLRFTLSYLSQKTELDGFTGATSGTYDQTILQVAPEHVLRGERGGIFDTDIDIANATMEYDFGWANVFATYSYTDSGSSGSESFTGFGGAAFNYPASVLFPSAQQMQVGEVRFATQLDGAWNVLAGLYTEERKDESLFDYRWHGDPATNFFCFPLTADCPSSLGISDGSTNLKQKAAFGEASWEFLPGLTITGGVRTYEYDRTIRTETSGPFYGVGNTRIDGDASGTNFRGNLSYKPADGMLLYAGWAQGFRLGSESLGLPATCDPDGDGIVDGTVIPIESTRRTDPDNLDSYEIGGRFALLDRRLAIDAAVFRMEWSDIPVTVIPTGGCGIGFTANAGKALSEGVEFQANLQVSDALRLNVGSSWIDAKLTAGVPTLGASKGDRLPGSPKFNANLGLQYDFAVGGYKAFVRTDSIYIGDFYGNLQESPDLEAGGYVKLDASARITIRNADFDLFVHNLTNEDAFAFRSTYAVGAGPFYGHRLRPRTIGLQLGYRF